MMVFNNSWGTRLRRNSCGCILLYAFHARAFLSGNYAQGARADLDGYRTFTQGNSICHHLLLW